MSKNISKNFFKKYPDKSSSQFKQVKGLISSQENLSHLTNFEN